MATGSGIEMRVGVAKETTYGTRVAPSRFFEVMSDDIDFDYEFYVSQGLGGGVWRKRRIQTTRRGGGGLPMEVPTTGFGFWLDLLHNETPTVVQQGATTAYLQTHSLASPPGKSASVQIQTPKADATGNAPFDYLGVMLSGAEFAWSAGEVLTFSPTLVVQEQTTTESLATPTTPPSGLFSFKGGSITIGGGAVADIIGDGSFTLEWPLRDDAYVLGSTGLIKKPQLNDRPAFTGELTADFSNMTHYNRVVNETIADVVLLFEGATISGAFKELFRITIPDCGFNSPRPKVEGPGPVTQAINFESASSTADVPTIEFQSTDVAI